MKVSVIIVLLRLSMRLCMWVRWVLYVGLCWDGGLGFYLVLCGCGEVFWVFCCVGVGWCVLFFSGVVCECFWFR